MHEKIDLSGTWQLSLSPDAPKSFDESIRLPGSIQAQGFGDPVTMETPWIGEIVDRSWFTAQRYEKYRQPGNIKIPFWLQPETYFRGKAWFTREIDIPESWQGQRIVLFLERPHIQTTLWIDDREIGTRDTLAAPHTYDLGAKLVPGKHRLLLCVDNQMHVNVGPNSHSVTDHTQSNWNGVVGAIELRTTPPVWLDDVQIYPNINTRSIRLKISIGNHTGEAGSAELRIGDTRFPVQYGVEGGTAELECKLLDAQLWDEFQPILHSVKLQLTTAHGVDVREDRIGLRELGVEGTQFTINGRKIFLRGTLECCVFPRTGYPPTEKSEWDRIFKLIQEYGFNHVRFHSWCPPKAAFDSADEWGLYLQVECSSWAQGRGLGFDLPVDRWLYREAAEIIKAYGNHPSFAFMAYGNEPSGKHVEYLTKWVTYWREAEPRRLHTSGAGWPALPVNQFDLITEPRIQVWGDRMTSNINLLPPATTIDYQIYVDEVPRPVVSHEIGQWCVYPDFTEIPKYTGPLKARNFEIFQESLAANGMANQAQDFVQASGKLQILCYREELESALRTKGFAGYQVLQMNDFPGQGTALVGWMNPFWESKGYTTAEEFQRFNSQTVLLARLDRRTFTQRTRLGADIEIAHFGAAPLPDAVVYWQVVDEAGHAHREGSFPAREIPLGNGIGIGSVDISLQDLRVPARYRLVIGIRGTSHRNEYDIWVYPERGTARSGKVRLIRDWDNLVKQTEVESKVLFLPPAGAVRTDVSLGFSSIFWNTAWTRRHAPHTLGILCDPKQPIFADFPTDSHSNWQWWELLQNASSFLFDGLPSEFRPLVQVIDDWVTNRKIGLLFEARIGDCRIVVSGMDLLGSITVRHVARQLRQSILNYMESDAFQPQFSLDIATLGRTLRHPDPTGKSAIPVRGEEALS